MNIREKLRGAMRRIAGVSVGEAVARATGLWASRETSTGRRTAAMPTLLNTFGFSRTGAAHSQVLLPKPTPANLRRFAETPVARRAINTIKDRIAGMRWRLQPRRGRALEHVELRDLFRDRLLFRFSLRYCLFLLCCRFPHCWRCRRFSKYNDFRFEQAHLLRLRLGFCDRRFIE